MTDKEKIQAVLSDHDDLNSIAFHCPDIQTMKRLVKALYELGFYWAPGTEYEDRVAEQRWNEKKKNTGIVIGNLKYEDQNVLWHGRIKMYENQGRKIIEAPDLFNNVDLNDNTDAEISKAPLDPQISPKCQNDTLDDTLELSEENKASLPTEQTQTSKKCPQCGNEMPAKAKFCNRCGHAFAKDEKVNTDNSTARANNNENVSQKQNETKSQKPVHDVVVQEPVATTKLESEKAEQSAPRDKNTTKVSIQDQPTISDGSSEPQEREQLRTENKTNKHLPLLCQLLGVKVNEPFCFVNATYFSNCVYRVNDNGLREVRVGDDFWLPCQNEGELVYLLQHHQNIKAVE